MCRKGNEEARSNTGLALLAAIIRPPWREIFGLLLPSRRKCLINFLRYFLQPSFGPIRSLSIAPDFRLKPRDFIFGDPKLHRRLVGDAERVLCVLLGDRRRSLNSHQNVLPRAI